MEKLESIQCDLAENKITLQFHGINPPLVVHFDTPSRRFYFSIIALIIAEMKKQGRPVKHFSSQEIKKAIADAFETTRAYMPFMKEETGK